MSLKAKLISTIAAVCMVICLLSVGIFAASTGTVNVGGSVSFSATDVNVQIELVSVTGAGTAGTNYTKEAIVWDSTDTAETLSENWTDMNFTFQKNAENPETLDDIVITIRVTNLSEERDLNVKFTKTSTDNGDATVTFTEVAAEGETIAKGGTTSKDYTITLHTDKTSNETVKATSFTGTLVVTDVPNAG